MRALIAAAVLVLAGAVSADARTFDDGWRYDGRAVDLPYQWNAHDDSIASMLGRVGTFTKDVRLPAGTHWRLGFGSVSGRARVSVDGRVVGRHRGAFLPFEVPLAGGRHTVSVRVDNRRRLSDFPPRADADGVPAGGWWNAGGILRDVTLRQLDGPIDLRDVTVVANAAGAVTVRGVVANEGDTPQTTALSGEIAGVAFGAPVVLAPHAVRTVVARATVPSPRRWSPDDPHLYPVTVSAGQTTRQLRTGFRTVDVRGGRLRLNGRPLRLRGVGYHEETAARGMAITQADRARLLDQAQALGANVMRTHYPPGPGLAALADRRGMLLWSEIPVYTMRQAVLARPAVRRRAVAMLERNIVVNGSHPSIVAWSVGNELGPPDAGQARYLRAAADAAHALDATRPVALATKAYTTSLCRRAYAPLDIIGLNEYFGWYYDGDLSGYLDRARRCYPRKALVITEYGAEANRRGPASEKGTYAFQARFVAHALATFANKPWLSGSLYWALREFRVRPGWAGGNPLPSPPLHKKGLLTENGTRKPAWAVVHRRYTRSGTR